MDGLEGLELSTEQLETVKGVIATQVDSQVDGLKTKNSDLLGKIKASNTSIADLETKVKKFEVLGDLDPNKVREMFDNIEQGEVDAAMKALGVTEDQLKPIIGKTLEKAQKDWETKSNQTINALTTERDDLSSRTATLEERVKVMQLDEVAKSAFNALSDAEKGAETVAAEQVRKVFTLDEDGKAVALDEDGELLLDSKKQPLTIQTFVNENLRESMGFLFVAPQGGGGKGGRGSALSGFGTGITDRKDNSPQTMAKFINAAVQAGKTRQEATAAWSALPSGKDK